MKTGNSRKKAAAPKAETVAQAIARWFTETPSREDVIEAVQEQIEANEWYEKIVDPSPKVDLDIPTPAILDHLRLTAALECVKAHYRPAATK